MSRFASKLTCRTRAGDIVFDGRKCAYLPKSETLLIADMHFEKGSYLRVKGRSVLPPLDTIDTIARLSQLVWEYAPKRIIALGDSFHDIEADQRLSPKDAQALNALTQSGAEWVWILGNHDPDIPNAVKGAREDHMTVDGFLLTHHPHETEGTEVNICGHYHPKARVRSRAGSVSAPCFAVSDSCLILPSFGTFTGGLFVTDPAFKAAMPDMKKVVMAYENRLFSIKAETRAVG